ncbi:hypothetical protein K3G39_17035 [Pontibacter sp. HSC-14F20]|uniref:hypothetical protein n=1 Tax=Pontibacter sp. HSC-14F20 TaxID=2864136 RepID=UPI001C73DE81|nr:hypothetical protein [Pontibacter sp. HSC-14F20]MBX0334945.1 hypothetical protein [Pontibacter sp. HSC-14F20]
MRRALLLLVVLSAFVAGCESKYKDPDPQAMGYDYYPLEIGQYRVYEVEETFYFGETPSNRNYQLRERVDTSFIDQTGQEVYKIIRSTRPNATVSWLDDSVMTVAKNEQMVILTKDNTRYIKLVFPVKNALEFVGDLYNVRQASDNTKGKVRDSKEVYTYENVGSSYDLGGQVYPTTATVVQTFHTDETKLDNRYEVYAEGIGMIHRVFDRIDYESCQGGSGCIDGSKIKNGHAREEILIEHGKL